MKTAQEKVANWMATYGQDVPSKPGIPSLEVRRLRAKLILEESLETIEALGFAVYKRDEKGNSFQLMERFKPNITAIADGCADLHVVTLGTEVACGLNAEANFNEVMRSNDSKMWSKVEILTAMANDRSWEKSHTREDVDPECLTGSLKCYVVKTISGKVVKSPSYSPANLQPIIEGEK